MPDRRNDLSDVQQDIAAIKTEIRWHKWLLFTLLAAVISPKLGGPDAAEIAGSLLNIV